MHLVCIAKLHIWRIVFFFGFLFHSIVLFEIKIPSKKTMVPTYQIFILLFFLYLTLPVPPQAAGIFVHRCEQLRQS